MTARDSAAPSSKQGGPVASDWICRRFGRRTSVGLALGIAVVATTTWLVSRPPATNCSGGPWPDSSGHVILASKVVVRPWHGRHHVYGTFMIPSQFRDARYAATLSVRGSEVYAALTGSSVESGYGDNLAIWPGQKMVSVQLQTRVALWFLVTGHFGDLRTACNWALVLTSDGG